MKSKETLPIVTYGEKSLRESCVRINEIDEDIKLLIKQMAITMSKNNGVGLAAPQVGENLQLFMIDITGKKKDLKVFINPKILKLEGRQVGEEGCLSVPGIYADVPRAEFVEVQAQDIEGNKFVLEAEGLLAIAIQHENDHLHGKLFIDYLDKLEMMKIKSKLEEIKCKAKQNK